MQKQDMGGNSSEETLLAVSMSVVMAFSDIVTTGFTAEH
jgi:hypothetical protein